MKQLLSKWVKACDESSELKEKLARVHEENKGSSKDMEEIAKNLAKSVEDAKNALRTVLNNQNARLGFFQRDAIFFEKQKAIAQDIKIGLDVIKQCEEEFSGVYPQAEDVIQDLFGPSKKQALETQEKASKVTSDLGMEDTKRLSSRPGNASADAEPLKQNLSPPAMIMDSDLLISMDKLKDSEMIKELGSLSESLDLRQMVEFLMRSLLETKKKMQNLEFSAAYASKERRSLEEENEQLRRESKRIHDQYLAELRSNMTKNSELIQQQQQQQQQDPPSSSDKSEDTISPSASFAEREKELQEKVLSLSGDKDLVQQQKEKLEQEKAALAARLEEKEKEIERLKSQGPNAAADLKKPAPPPRQSLVPDVGSTSSLFSSISASASSPSLQQEKDLRMSREKQVLGLITQLQNSQREQENLRELARSIHSSIAGDAYMKQISLLSGQVSRLKDQNESLARELQEKQKWLLNSNEIISSMFAKLHSLTDMLLEKEQHLEALIKEYAGLRLEHAQIQFSTQTMVSAQSFYDKKKVVDLYPLLFALIEDAGYNVQSIEKSAEVERMIVELQREGDGATPAAEDSSKAPSAAGPNPSPVQADAARAKEPASKKWPRLLLAVKSKNNTMKGKPAPSSPANNS